LAPPNHLRFRLSPEVILEIGARAKRPGEALAGEEVLLDAMHKSPGEMPAYERLLGDAMKGDAMLFAREDSVEASWRIVDGVIGENAPRAPIHFYEPGSWGPPEADRLLGGSWRDPV